MTLSDAFAGGAAAAVVRGGTAKTAGGARAHARMRTRGPIVRRVTAWLNIMWADLRDCWWLPASIPPLRKAWAERVPDLSRVPGENPALHRAWVVYNHTLGLLAPAVAVGIVAALTPAVWIVLHPARLGLALLLLTPLVATAVALIH